MNRLMTTLALFGASLPAFAGITHWAVPAMSDVQRLPDAEPKDGEKGGVVRIVAAKGEYEPGSFVLCSDADLGKVKLELGEFKQVEGGRSKVEQRTDKNSTVQPSTSNLQPPVVFPKANLDLKVIKVWYQNKNGWFSYFGDTGFKLCPELLLNDEDLIRVDTKKEANYARLVEADGRVHERWINPPRQMDKGYHCPWESGSGFQPMKPNFRDAQTLQPVAFPKGVHKQFFLTVHVTKEIPAGLYRGEVKVKGGGEGGGGQRNVVCSVPVEIKVLDFELPAPKGYLKPQVDFRVASYNYLDYEIIGSYNGGDVELSKRQFEAILRDQVAHNQLLHMSRTGNPFQHEFALHLEAQRKAGMCTDPYFVGALNMYNLYNWGRPGPDGIATNAARAKMDLKRLYGHANVYVTYGDEPSSAEQRRQRGLYEIYQNFGFKFCIAGNQQTYNPNGYLWDWFNCAAEPTDPTMVDLWSKTLDIPVAWYAQQHVGAENPALNRRQNGLGAWLTGYTALNNYAHHLGSWNDDSTTYKPMVYAYGIYDGVVDTIQWEGFREGVDDVRYGTLMCRLAREAQQRGDIEAKKAGGKALQYLAMFNREADDLNVCRAEMIRYIEKLRAVLAAPPKARFDITLPTWEEDLAKLEAKAAAAKGEWEAKKDDRKLREAYCKAVRSVSAHYRSNARHDKGVKVLEDAGLWEDAVRYWSDGYFKGAYYLSIEGKRAREEMKKVLAREDCPAGIRRDAYLALRADDPALADRYAADFWGKTPQSTNEAVNALLNVFGGWNSATRIHCWRYTEGVKAVRRLGRVASVDGRSVGKLIFSYADLGELKAFDETVDLLFAGTNTISGATAYRLRLARATLSKRFATVAEAERAVRDFDAKARGKLAQKDVVACLEDVGSAASACENENLVRALATFRKALYKPQERRLYTIRYSEKPVAGESDWAALKLESQKMDRDFGGSMEFLVTDVATGNRGEVATGDKKKKAAPPEMQVVADENGVHFRFSIPDPNARKVQLKLAGAGSFEMYLGPGANTPYVCFLLTPGSHRVDTFNTTYDIEGDRMLRRNDVEKVQFNTVYYDDRIVCTLDLAWSLYATHLPKDGDVWDFESARWGSAGGQCWNGMESIHGRSTWGALKFALSEKQRLSIVRRQVFAAWANYKFENTAWRHEGCLKHWEDTETGDPAFHAAVVKPLMEKLEPYSKLMKADMSDEDLKKVYAEAYPTWANIEHVIGRLRAKYLADK